MFKTLQNQMFVTAVLVALTATPSTWAEQKSHEELKEAFRACEQELGIARPEPGTRPQAPDEETRAKLDTCLINKGFEVPKFGRGGPGKGHPERPTEYSRNK